MEKSKETITAPDLVFPYGQENLPGELSRWVDLNLDMIVNKVVPGCERSNTKHLTFAVMNTRSDFRTAQYRQELLAELMESEKLRTYVKRLATDLMLVKPNIYW